MKRRLAEKFDREVENYRKALLYYARARDWETFQAKAGRLFDYVESIELEELERRFFRIFSAVLGILVLTVVVVFSVDFEVHRELISFKNAFILTAVAVSSFELYYFLDYRIYTGVKSRYYRKRRESFIRGIEHDFRGFAVNQERKAA